MDIEEVLKRRKELEQHISEMIMVFEKYTHTTIEEKEIVFDRVDARKIGDVETHICQVNISLPIRL